MALKKILIFLLLAVPGLAIAQADANKVLCFNQAISITSPDSANTYHWYKVVNGNAVQQAQAARVYNESPAASGYYNYQLVLENGNGCISPVSDVFKIYVLPDLQVSVTTPAASICATLATSVLLTANVPAGFDYTYQWTRNGVSIAGATSSTFNVLGEISPGSIVYGVSVSYVLNGSCSYSATKTITVAPQLAKATIQ